ncbi:hypothetical protein, conserved [Eimeria necatrix]|uniref:Uncharacterized protein n=1 Tax=Eimeria necatrix TaxID=51315 RepID=U6MS32_9EIME|nr:hypothetical protein, conserved [Eimeria necatrix]CDJ65898.1 hypothetical protein, conserved [Eimeria necatrix]
MSGAGAAGAGAAAAPAAAAATAAAAAAAAAAPIDTDLYSRQIGTLGMDTMKKLVQLKVLVSGLNGVGAECG